ncbi:hypothetical protein GCM10027089_33410 [Nocardia thraciensis]
MTRPPVHPESCPAPHGSPIDTDGPRVPLHTSVAYMIAQDAIDQLLDALPDLSLAVDAAELTWRPGPFHRALTGLPVRFPKSPPLHV